MRIAVNTRLLLPGKLDGIGWFSYHTLSRITKAHSDIEFLFLFDRPWSEEFVFADNVTPVAIFPQARHPFLYYLWFEYAIPIALEKHKADLFLSPDGYLSLSTTTPQVGVIHDLNFEHYPADLPFLTRKYYRNYFPRFARMAKRLATVSEFSKQDIVQQYKVDPSKIDVVFNGVDERFVPLAEPEKNQTRQLFTNGNPYFLFVGMLHQRKNIANLFRAYEIYKSSVDSSTKLLIVGHKKWWTAEMESVFNSMQFKDDVIFSGRLSMDELTKVTASALAMMYVSVFEGFGVPIIEAMRSGVPVITSNVTSMPEVSSDAALLIDPFNVESISSAMITINNDASLRQSLIIKGLIRSNDFSWNLTSEKLWKCILKALA